MPPPSLLLLPRPTLSPELLSATGDNDERLDHGEEEEEGRISRTKRLEHEGFVTIEEDSCNSPKHKASRTSMQGRAPAASAIYSSDEDETGKSRCAAAHVLARGGRRSSRERNSDNYSSASSSASSVTPSGWGGEIHQHGGSISGPASVGGFSSGAGSPTAPTSDSAAAFGAPRRLATQEVMGVLAIYIHRKYTEAIAGRMLALIEPKIRRKVDSLSDAQLEVLRDRAREKQEGTSSSGVDEMFERMMG